MMIKKMNSLMRSDTYDKNIIAIGFVCCIIAPSMKMFNKVMGYYNNSQTEYHSDLVFFVLDCIEVMMEQDDEVSDVISNGVRSILLVQFNKKESDFVFHA